jgi:hypothetical protein
MPIDTQGPDEFRRYLRDHGMKTRRLLLEQAGKETIFLDAQVEYYHATRMRGLTQALMTHPRWKLVKIQL